MWFGKQIATDENDRAFMPSEPYRDRSGSVCFLVLEGVHYCDNIEAGLLFFRLRNRAPDYLVDCAFLTVTDEQCQLLGSGQLAELHRTVDFQRTILQGFYQLRVSDFEDRFNVANIAWASGRDVSNLSPNIDALNVWQICQTFVLAAGAHVLQRPLPKAGLES